MWFALQWTKWQPDSVFHMCENPFCVLLLWLLLLVFAEDVSWVGSASIHAAQRMRPYVAKTTSRCCLNGLISMHLGCVHTWAVHLIRSPRTHANAGCKQARSDWSKQHYSDSGFWVCFPTSHSATVWLHFTTVWRSTWSINLKRIWFVYSTIVVTLHANAAE